MMTNSNSFIEALETGNKELLKTIPKTDFHNHAGLGYKRSRLETWLGRAIAIPPRKVVDFHEFDSYIVTHLRDIYINGDGFEFAIESVLADAKEDSVIKLESSIDALFARHYKDKQLGFINFLKEIHQKIYPSLDFRPEIGFAKNSDTSITLPMVMDCIDTGYFMSMDMYGNEMSRENADFIDIFRYAKSKGLKLKAHIGEYCNANTLRTAVEILELDAIQHGISAASSPSVMRFLADNNIQLNICPTSNVCLSRVESLKVHPIRILFDHGVKVTINTDDIFIFEQTVSDEYLNLYNAGLFSAKELDSIRLTGLNS